MSPTAAPEEIIIPFRPRGGMKEIFSIYDREVLVEGPAGTGKTRAILELLHLACKNRPIKTLVMRKTHRSLADSVIHTYQNKVLHPLDGVKFFGGNSVEPEAFQYPNGSRLILGGMDDPSKVLSTEYDKIYVNEATEIKEDEWVTLLNRLRNFKHPHMQAFADCNPTYGKHWLNRRASPRMENGVYLPPLMRRVRTTHRDNPLFYDDEGNLTEEGEIYIHGLELSNHGSMRERFLLGNWVGVENAIYPHFDRALHVRPLESGVRFRTGAIGVDYGRRHKAAAVAISVDQYGRRWVREAWGEPDTEHGEMTRKMVGQLMRRYTITTGRTDPTIDGWIGTLPLVPAKSHAGARNGRTITTGRLLNIFPGGIIPESWEEAMWAGKERSQPLALGGRPDSPGLLFVEGAPGIDALCDEIESYHEVLQENDTKSEYTVARIDDDMVAAMEYAVEHLEEQQTDHAQMGDMLRSLRRKPTRRR
jgi:hypothetical protein